MGGYQDFIEETLVSRTINGTAKFIGKNNYILTKWGDNPFKNLGEIIMYISSEIFINGFSFEDDSLLHNFRIIAEYHREHNELISDDELLALSFYNNPLNTKVIEKIKQECEKENIAFPNNAKTISELLKEYYKRKSPSEILKIETVKNKTRRLK